MQIQFSFDDNEVDAVEPLGSVTISEGAESLHVETVWLDDFFQGLVQAYDTALAGGTASVELDSEPDFILMTSIGKGLRVEYAGASVQLTDLSEFGENLRMACFKLVNSIPDRERNPILVRLTQFATHKG